MKKFNKAMICLLISSILASPSTAIASEAEITDAKAISGVWHLTGLPESETKCEFHEDGYALVSDASGDTVYTAEGTYQFSETKNTINFELTDLESGETNTLTLFYKLEDNHLALYDSDYRPMETNARTEYYTLKDSAEYNLLEEVIPLRHHTWKSESGLSTLTLNNEEYPADTLYFEFEDYNGNRMSVGQPEEMGASTYAVLEYAPFELSDDRETITFYFNNPLGETETTSYKLEVSDDALTLTAEDGKVLSFVPVV